MPQLSVRVSIAPRQSEISVQELDQLFAGEVSKFEAWFVARQQKSGFEATRLMSAEHAILRSFMYYIHTTQVPDGDDQTQHQV